MSKAIAGNAGRFDIDNGMTLCMYHHKNMKECYPDEYIVFRDWWLAQRRMNYDDMRFNYNECFTKFTPEFYDMKKIVLMEE